MIYRAGIPAYQHDWSFPFTREGVISGLIGHISLWDSSGLGRPNALASANPLLIILSVLGLLFGPVGGAKIAIAAAATLAALSATFCARRTISRDPVAASLAGIMFATSPVLFNKIAAGHVTFWFAYALLPLIFERARAAQWGERSAVLWTAFLCAITTIQPQFAAFSLIVVMAASFSPHKLRAAAVVFCVSLAAIAIALAPTAWAVFSARADILAQFPWPVLTWENAHSAPMGLALLTSHYIIPYYDRALHSQAAFVRAGAAAGLLGALLAMRRRDGISLAALIVVGLCFTTGTTGALSMVWRWLFAHVEAAASFRELYNANALVALGYSMGAAALAREALLGKLFATALVTLSAVPIVCGSLGSVVHNIVDNDVSFRSEIAQTPSGRVLYLPSLTPLVRNGSEPGGVDVFAVGDQTHAPLTEYPPEFPLTTLAVTGDTSDAWWRRLAERFGVNAIVLRPNLRSETDLHTAGTRPAPNWSFEALHGLDLIETATAATRERLSFRTPAKEGVEITGALGALPERFGAARVVLPRASLQSDDPAQAWVPLDRWRNVAPDPANAVPEGVVTTSRATLTMTLPPGQWWLLATSQRAVSITSGSWRSTVAAASARWVPLKLTSGEVHIRGNGGRAVVYRVASGKTLTPAGPFAAGIQMQTRRPWPWVVNVHLRRLPAAPVLLVFRERFSENWRVRGATTLWHGIADGYANAFAIRKPAYDIAIVYEPQRVFFIIAAFSTLAYLMTIVAIVRLRRA
ncbi:MAG: hypothetical protein JO135_05650 [Candidatus Eremiobacteraeota bacterium]|nr:hypothetical protein [Candidatus Eremiobacteraeota bacterium]